MSHPSPKYSCRLAMLLIACVVGCDQSRPIPFDKQLLQGVIDRGSAFDQMGYYELLDHSRLVSGASLEKAGKQVAYDELMANPQKHRGEPVVIEGVLWRLYGMHHRRFVDYEIKAERPDAPYEAWIVDKDSNPYRIICSRLPKELEPGDGLRRVKVTGYFFMIEDNYCESPEEFNIDSKIVRAPTLFAQRLVLAGTDPVDPEFDVRFTPGEPVSEHPFPPIRIHLSNVDPALKEIGASESEARVTLGGYSLGTGDSAFRKLNKDILQIIGRPNNPLTEGLKAVIDVSPECSHQDVAKTVANCAWRDGHPETRYLEKVMFAVPHLPKQ